jgi:putative ABC transport system permease protein
MTLAIPLIYNVRSVRVRWVSSVVAVVGIAGAVGVFVAMLSLAKGFEATLLTSGSPSTVIVRRAGATSEMDTAVSRENARIIGDAPGVARSAAGEPIVSGEVVVVAALPLAATGTDANVQLRGVTPLALQARDILKISEGRFFEPRIAELVVGKNARATIAGMRLGSRARFGGRDWTVVGVLDGGGSAFDSEVWCDVTLLQQAFDRPANIFQSVTVKLDSPDSLQKVKDALTADPRLDVQLDRERDYYAKQSIVLSTLIRVLGFLVAFVMGIGAVFAALNTMYSAVAARSREVATLRALGFGGASVVASLVFESVLIALVGGLVGCAAVLPVNGLTVSTLNFQTFSQLAFAFRVTPLLCLAGIIFALFMGLVGGLLPAVRAARLPIASALREL